MDSATYLQMQRQHFVHRANPEEYIALYRDAQPGQNVYWNGFGQPPTLSFRADFDDLEFNRERLAARMLIKGRFAGGNLGWIMPEDLELFTALYRKPLDSFTENQARIFDMIERSGPYTIHQIKEETGLLVKTITPILHRLQEAFLIYEDQYDEDWERGWYRFGEMFPEVNLDRYTRIEALKIVLRRFAHRMVKIDVNMARSFYRLPLKDIKKAFDELLAEGVLVDYENGFVLAQDIDELNQCAPKPLHFVHAIHRNDMLYKAYEPLLKDQFSPLYENLPYDHEPLQYLLIDGEFHGATIGHFRNGPYDLNDVICDLPDAEMRKEEILEAVRRVNFGRMPLRFNGTPIEFVHGEYTYLNE